MRADAGSRVLILAYTAIVGQPAMLQQSSRRFTVAGRPVRWLSCALATAKAAVYQGNSGNDQFGEAIVGKLITEISALPPRWFAGTE